jgi:hypothetical protein
MPLLKNLLMLTLIRGELASSQTVSFLPPANPFVFGASRGAGMCYGCFAVADFNRDGKADVGREVRVWLTAHDVRPAEG